MSRTRKRAGRGALVILSLLLASSGALRLGDGFGMALARAPIAGDGAAPLNCPTPPAALAKALSDRETQVASREAALAERLAALDLANAAIDQRMTALTEAEAKLSATLSLADGAAEADLARLTSVYEAMKPKDAAKLFASMDPEFSAGFLGRMQPAASAAILSGMPPDSAYAVSAILAGRNALVPKN